jgi:RB1-inducible coiled-coil protein 1
MLKNHEHLLDIRARCTRAKEELCQNLHVRLKWVMYVENMICDVGSRLMMYHEKLKRLRRRFDVIQQIHLSPQMYINAVGEVVRRRTFSQAFLLVS